MKTLAQLIIVLMILSHEIALAEVQTITATHTYVMGDNDSRNDARQLCFLEAKRKVLEKAGSYIQSQTEATNFKLTKDQVSSYSAAVLSVEITKEDFTFSNGHNNLTLTVKADVDMADVQRRLQAIAADKGLQSRITDQQQQIKQLEQQVRQLNERVNLAPASSATDLRKERNVVFGNIEELENKKLAAIKVIGDQTEKVKKYIVTNMTMKEVEDIMGAPRGALISGTLLHSSNNAWNYGDLWIRFHGGVVKCISREQYC
jgi:hypothetical protein